jgi:cysteinyl-tRNA synthetase
MKKLDEVLGLMLITPPSILENIELPVEVKNLVKERETARAEKDFTKSDALRVKIEALGFELMDTENGQKVKKKPQI